MIGRENYNDHRFANRVVVFPILNLLKHLAEPSGNEPSKRYHANRKNANVGKNQNLTGTPNLWT